MDPKADTVPSAEPNPYGALNLNFPRGFKARGGDEEVREIIRKYEESQMPSGERPTALHVFFPYPDVCCISKALPEDYKFRQVVDGRAEHYKWLTQDRPDAVPAASSYIMGVTVLIVGEDGCVLIITEKKADGRPARRKKAISGGVNLGELPTDAGMREVKEEVGLNLRDYILPVGFQMVGGYCFANARPGNIGDVHLCFLARTRIRLVDGKPVARDPADNTDKEVVVQPDPNEIFSVEWWTREKMEGVLRSKEERSGLLSPEWFEAGLEAWSAPRGARQTGVVVPSTDGRQRITF